MDVFNDFLFFMLDLAIASTFDIINVHHASLLSGD